MGPVLHLSPDDRRRHRQRGRGCGQRSVLCFIVMYFSFTLLVSLWLISAPCRRSEYQLARPSDSHRKEMLFGSLAKPGHPMSKFCWGKSRFINAHLTSTVRTQTNRFRSSRSGLRGELSVVLSGNAQTLKHEPREKQINTYQRLRDFWRRYYSAHYMTLAVQSKGTQTPRRLRHRAAGR